MPTKTPSTVLIALLLGAVVLSFFWLVSTNGKDSRAQVLGPGVSPPEAANALQAPPELLAIPEASNAELRSPLNQVAPSKAETRTSSPKQQTFRGRVFEPQGRPVADALVALMQTRNGAPFSSVRSATTETDHNGEFEITVPDWALGARVLVSARKEGWRPFSSVETMSPSFLEAEQELSLGAGFAISGRVVRDGLAVPNAQIKFDVAKGASGIRGAGSECWWADGRLEEKRGSLKTGEDGSFQITGLSPAEHRISVSEGKATDHSIPSSVVARVTAPDTRTYELSTAMLRITVQGPAGPVEGAKVKASAESGRVKFKSGPFPKEVSVPALTTIKVTATDSVGETEVETVKSPQAGQVLDVFLDIHHPERPRLIVKVPGATAADVEWLSLQIVKQGSFEVTKLVAIPTGQLDTYVVDVVPRDEGHYIVVLHPKGSKGIARFIMPEKRSIELPRVGDVFIEYPLRFGGLCEVKLHSPCPDAWSATYQLRDAAGKVRMKRIFRQSAKTGRVAKSSEMSLSTRTARGALSNLHEVLPPGEYAVEVTSKSHETWTGTVTVTAGEKVKLRVDLEPKP